MPERRYYVPVTRGLEIKIGEALAARRARDCQGSGCRQIMNARFVLQWRAYATLGAQKESDRA